MTEAMTGREYYTKHGYDELPESVRKEMSRVFDTGVNNSGVWVRFKEVENLAGIMAYEYMHRPIATNADRIRSLSDEELAEFLEGEYGNMLPNTALDWLKAEVEDGKID